MQTRGSLCTFPAANLRDTQWVLTSHSLPLLDQPLQEILLGKTHRQQFTPSTIFAQLAIYAACRASSHKVSSKLHHMQEYLSFQKQPLK